MNPNTTNTVMQAGKQWGTSNAEQPESYSRGAKAHLVGLLDEANGSLSAITERLQFVCDKLECIATESLAGLGLDGLKAMGTTVPAAPATPADSKGRELLDRLGGVNRCLDRLESAASRFERL